MTEPADAGAARRYQAFICYSHHDWRWAKWLQRAIEAYRVPRALRGRATSRGTIPARCGPVFLDRTETHADPNLRRQLFDAIDRSANFLLVCSPDSAAAEWCAEEIRYFRKSGRGDRLFCLIVRGEPNDTDPKRRAFSPALSEEIPGAGPPAVPLAADVRRDGDGKRDALLKIIAAMLGVSFDDLRRRDRAARRRQLTMQASIAGIVAVLLAASYYFALLDGQHVPFYAAATRTLNEHHWILPRPIPRARDVAASAADLRANVADTLWARGSSTGWYWHKSKEEQRVTFDGWTAGQALSGLLSLRDLDPKRRDTLIAHALLLQTQRYAPLEENGVRYGWLGYDPRVPLNETWPEEALWYVSALSRTLALDPSPLSAQQRRDVQAALRYAQSTTDAYRDPQHGGWDGIADQVNRSAASTYTTAVALQALLDAKRAHAGWDGDAALRDRLIASTANRLFDLFHLTGDERVGLQGLSGWNGSVDDENPMEEGLTLQVFAMLLRAEAEAGYHLPKAVAESIPPNLEKLQSVTYGGIQGTNSTAHFVEPVRTRGCPCVRTRARYIDFAWYPWAIACSELWLRRIKSHPGDSPTAETAKRALGHLIVDLQSDAAADASVEHPWAAGELLVALNLAPLTERDLRELGFK